MALLSFLQICRAYGASIIHGTLIWFVFPLRASAPPRLNQFPFEQIGLSLRQKYLTTGGINYKSEKSAPEGHADKSRRKFF
jgi:hypothetical protein